MEYLYLKDITKRYKETNILANDHITLSIFRGEIHAIVGDNGAGKSTLGKILYGILEKDEGEIFLDGEKLSLLSESIARVKGIYFVPQEDFFIGKFKVWENIVLGGEETVFGFLNRRVLRKKVIKLMDKYDLHLPLDLPSQRLSMGQKRILSLLKALYKRPRLLILDEPTSFLPDPQVEGFLNIVSSLKKRGLTIIFISHRWKEIEKIADRVTVLDKGKILGTYKKEEFSRIFRERYPMSHKLFIPTKRKNTENEVLLRLSHVYYEKEGDIPLIDISMEVRRGEIVSLVCVSGNGERELEQIVSGYISPDRGDIYIKGKKYSSVTPKILRENGISIIPTEMENGICDYGTLWENLIISRQREGDFSHKGFLKFDYIERYAKERLSIFELPYKPDIKAAFLSGGRKKRLVLSRELREDRDLIIAGNPTSSLDRLFTEKTLYKLKSLSLKGKGVLFFSHNIDDALSISDKIVVLYRGKIKGVFERDNITRDRLIKYIVGEGSA